MGTGICFGTLFYLAVEGVLRGKGGEAQCLLEEGVAEVEVYGEESCVIVQCK